MTKSFFFFYMQLGKSKSGKSSLFFFRQAECTIFEHPCFWWNILEMQRLLAELGISESYLDQRLHLVGDLYFFESFIRGSLEVYTSALWKFWQAFVAFTLGGTSKGRQRDDFLNAAFTLEDAQKGRGGMTLSYYILLLYSPIALPLPQ